MKIKNYLLTGLIALGMLSTSCSKDEFEGDNLQHGDGVITVKLAGSNTRSLVTIENDSKINDYHVYVFSWTSGITEASEPGNPSGPTVIQKLSTANTKRVVVLANLGTYPKVNNYSELSEIANRINLDRQTPELAAEKGFIMSGESVAPVTLSGEKTVEESINLKRAVAKISLETITIVPEVGHEIEKLEILSVAAQRVTPEVTLAPITSYYETEGENAYHYGGFSSSDNQLRQKDYLIDILTWEEGLVARKEYELGNYFLVFPNGDDNNCTLLTIQAKYDGHIIYYPIKVNYLEEKFIESNKHYKLNITLKKFGDGTVDPEVPATDADLEVSVTVDEWDVITQNEEW